MADLLLEASQFLSGLYTGFMSEVLGDIITGFFNNHISQNHYRNCLQYFSLFEKGKQQDQIMQTSQERQSEQILATILTDEEEEIY